MKKISVIILCLLLGGCTTNNKQPVILKEGNTYVPIITDTPKGVVLLPITKKIEEAIAENKHENVNIKPIFVPAQEGKQPSIDDVKEAISKEGRDANIVTVEPIPQPVTKIEPVMSDSIPTWKKVLGTIINIAFISGIILFLYKKRDWFGFDKKIKQ